VIEFQYEFELDPHSLKVENAVREVLPRHWPGAEKAPSAAAEGAFIFAQPVLRGANY
jgi:hypothetical protein